MPDYHLLLFAQDETRTIVQIEAETNAQAAAIATAVFHSCVDTCVRFELRHGARWIAGMGRLGVRRELQLEELTAQTQERVAETERHILESRSRIASSASLLARTDRLVRRLKGHSAA